MHLISVRWTVRPTGSNKLKKLSTFSTLLLQTHLKLIPDSLKVEVVSKKISLGTSLTISSKYVSSIPPFKGPFIRLSTFESLTYNDLSTSLSKSKREVRLNLNKYSFRQKRREKEQKLILLNGKKVENRLSKVVYIFDFIMFRTMFCL